VEIARGRDGRGKGAALNPDQAVFRHAAAALSVEIAPDRATDQYGDDDERNDSLHQLLRRYRGRTVSSKSAATDGTIQPREGDPVIGQGLAFGVLRLGEGELRVGELEDRSHTSVESTLGEPEILLGRGHEGLGRLDPLLGFLDGDLRLLDVL